jgi:type VI secretion system protein VasG
MVGVREKLFARLGQPTYRNFVEATQLCRSWRHEYVEIEHWLSAAMSHSQGDLPLLCNHYQLDTTQIVRDLDKILQTLPGRSASVADLSYSLESAVERGLLLNQLSDDAALPVRSIHILLSLLEESSRQRKLYRLSEEFKKLPLSEIFESWPAILAHSEEQAQVTVSSPAPELQLSPSANDEVLTRWCSDLTALAQAGKIDPVVGRDNELRQLLDVLLRRRQNNPILVGEAGVGKTAVVEALALLIASGNVPPMLKPARLLSLDLGRMQAGASARGEFEARLKALVDAIAGSAEPVLLFCDEAHTLVGAGGQAGTGDAVNLLKPMLARGELRMIAATTWSEYKQFIEPDAALTRRFQAITIDEPDADRAITMLRAVAEKFSLHHQVMIRESAISAAVTLSMRNLPARQLPDKAISVLDTACARVALAQHIEPAALVTCRSTLAALQQERKAIEAERHLLTDAESKLSAIDTRIVQYERELQQLSDALSKARSEPLQPESFEESYAPLIPCWVDDTVIADVLSDWTGIPTGRMLQSEVDTTLGLETRLGEALYGQPLALQQIAQAVRIARSGLQNPQRPLGVFMLTGPTGTGKTETARVLANAIYGGEHNLITFNMSEFKEAHSVSALKGAPPGYVGYGKGGKLTEAVRRNPWSVLLLDEFEKAHPDIHELFYQLFDRGVMEDGEGRQVNFRHCFILLTSNLGSEELTSALEQNSQASMATLRPVAHAALARAFAPALLARMTVVPYLPLSRDTLVKIANKRLSELQVRLQQTHQLPLHITDDVAHWLADRAAAHPSRGRAVENLLQQTLLPSLSLQLLKRQHSNEQLNALYLQIDDDAMTLHFE